MKKIKRFLKRLLLRYSYPRFLFAKQINLRVRERKFEGNLIIDAPCGAGLTSYWLAEKNQFAQVVGVDNNVVEINSISDDFKRENLRFEAADIYQMLDNQKQKATVFCLINSLFLLPDNSLLIQKINNVLYNEGQLFLIIPNIDGQNYKNFMKTEERTINIYEYTVKSLVEFMTKNGFSHVYTAPVARAYFYGRKELKYLSFLSPLYLYGLNFIQNILKSGEPSYWLVEFSKAAKQNND